MLLKLEDGEGQEKTKLLVTGMNLDLLNKSGKKTCATCLTGRDKNAIFCCGCLLRMHK